MGKYGAVARGGDGPTECHRPGRRCAPLLGGQKSQGGWPEPPDDRGRRPETCQSGFGEVEGPFCAPRRQGFFRTDSCVLCICCCAGCASRVGGKRGCWFYSSRYRGRGNANDISKERIYD